MNEQQQQTQASEGMPPIVYADDANESWQEAIEAMRGYNVRVSVIGGHQYDAQIVEVTRDEAGLAVLQTRSIDDESGLADENETPSAMPAELITSIYVY